MSQIKFIKIQEKLNTCNLNRMNKQKLKFFLLLSNTETITVEFVNFLMIKLCAYMSN